jgi:uncharacterized protein with HEPN domain
MRDDRERLLDIQEAIENIKKYASRGKKAFKEDELVQTWILHNLLTLGEAASRISDDFQEHHPEIPWFEIIGTRNILVHGYFKIDLEAIWSVVENDMPVLEENIKQLL